MLISSRTRFSAHIPCTFKYTGIYVHSIKSVHLLLHTRGSSAHSYELSGPLDIQTHNTYTPTQYTLYTVPQCNACMLLVHIMCKSVSAKTRTPRIASWCWCCCWMSVLCVYQQQQQHRQAEARAQTAESRTVVVATLWGFVASTCAHAPQTPIPTTDTLCAEMCLCSNAV